MKEEIYELKYWQSAYRHSHEWQAFYFRRLESLYEKILELWIDDWCNKKYLEEKVRVDSWQYEILNIHWDIIYYEIDTLTIED